MFNEVTLEHIRDAHKARVEALDHYERTREFQERQDFEAVEVHLSPKSYEHEFHRLLMAVCEGTGRWLPKNRALSKWLEQVDDSPKLIWLQGIPGAGECV